MPPALNPPSSHPYMVGGQTTFSIKIYTHIKSSELVRFTVYNEPASSVVDPCHFGTDPDPRV